MQTELDFIEQTSWVLFLRYIDQLESEKADETALEEKNINTFWTSNTVGQIRQCLFDRAQRPSKIQNEGR